MQQYLKNKYIFKKTICDFLTNRDIIEVQTPILESYAINDVYIDSLSINANKAINKAQKYYLHTSPELAMKELIAQGSGDIYQICQVFRDNEYGQYNSNEFTMLEWYRINFTMDKLISEVAELITIFMPQQKIHKISYQQAFLEFANIDIQASNLATLKTIAQQHKLTTDWLDITTGQMLLFVHLVEPKIKKLPICFIFDYPKNQAALAQIQNNVAKRFELYIYGIEIANGYQELQQTAEYRQRFLAQAQQRQQLGKKNIKINEQFLTNIKNGLPKCSGVALGFSRLFYLLARIS